MLSSHTVDTGVQTHGQYDGPFHLAADDNEYVHTVDVFNHAKSNVVVADVTLRAPSCVTRSAEMAAW